MFNKFNLFSIIEKNNKDDIRKYIIILKMRKKEFKF